MCVPTQFRCVLLSLGVCTDSVDMCVLTQFRCILTEFTAYNFHCLASEAIKRLELSYVLIHLCPSNDELSIFAYGEDSFLATIGHSDWFICL